MRVTLAQISPKLNRDFNLKKQIEVVKNSETELIIFPELSLNGYLLMDSVFDDAYETKELEELILLSFDKDIVVGVALKENNRYFNSALYLSNGKILHTHHKLKLPNYGLFEEARYFFAGDKIESFDTKFGKSIMVVCEDLWSSDIINQIVKSRVDFVIVIANSPSRVFLENGKLLIKEQWDSLLKTLSILSGAYIFFVNRVGFEDGLGFWGNSKIIAPNSIIENELPLFEEKIESFKIVKELSKVQKYLLRH